MADAAVLIVAQRINTILNADQIIVLDEGKIAGIGKHSELMTKLPGISGYCKIADERRGIDMAEYRKLPSIQTRW